MISPSYSGLILIQLNPTKENDIADSTYTFDDELDRSYLGRLMRINGLRSEVELLNLIARWAGFSEKKRRHLPSIELLALASGKELQDFVRTHSTLPYRRAITSYSPSIEHGCLQNRDMLNISGMRLARDGAYFCKICINIDHKYYGMAYWRRDHQLPGVLTCNTHDSRLYYSNSNSSFVLSPFEFIEYGMEISLELATLTKNNKVLIQFFAIGRGLLLNSAPISSVNVGIILRNIVSSLGFRTHCNNSISPLVSDYILQCYPHSWLDSVIPGLTKKKPNMVFHKIDGVFNFGKAPSSSVAYILVAAAIFSSTEEALTALNSCNITPVKHRKKRRSSSGLDAYAEQLLGWLKDETSKPLKQRRNLKQIHADLEDFGFKGSYSSVAGFVRRCKAIKRSAVE